MRHDIHVPNESDAFLFTSPSMRGRGLSPGDAAWREAVAAGDLLPLGVESEDPARVRVVVGAELEATEREEWVGLVRSLLSVPDGRLVVCGGVVYVLEKEDWAAEDARVVDVGPGTWRATVYCYASAPNGRWCVEQADTEPLGAWFRRTRPGQPMPSWLHNLCIHDPSLDPGHEKQWKRARPRGGGAVIDFLLHLEPADAVVDATPVNGDGILEGTLCRKPTIFPLGVAAVGLAGDDEEAEPVPPPANTVRAARAVPDPVPATGPVVTLPVAKFARLARLAWMCHPYTRPALTLVFPGKAPRLEDVEDATVKVAGRQVHVTFDDDGQPAGALAAMVALGKQLADVPDGTTLELDTARSSGGPLGLHRHRAVAEGGTWRVTGSYPAVDGARLTEALALAEALENGRRLVARDEEEAIRIETRAREKLADSFGSNGLQRSGAEVALQRRDPVLFAHVVARVFWSRYADTWPLQDEDAAG